MLNLFISHSLHGTEHLDFLHELKADLENEGANYSVFLDKTIPKTNKFGNAIFSKLSECDAAVFLLTKQALLDSDWVSFEYLISSYRQYFEPGFTILIVRLDDVSIDALKGLKKWDMFRPGDRLSLPDDPKNGYTLRKENYKKIISDIQKELVGTIKTCTVLTPISRARERIAECLRFKRDELIRLADFFNFPDMPVNPGHSENNLRSAIASALFNDGTRAMQEFLNCPQTRPLHVETQRSILENLSTHWVPMEAVSQLTRALELDNDDGYALNGKHVSFTHQRYFIASTEDGIGWEDIKINNPLNVLSQIRNELNSLLDLNYDVVACQEGRDESIEIDQYINKKLEARIQKKDPVFVVLHFTFRDQKELISEIQQAYPKLRVLVYTNSVPGGFQLDQLKLLKPEISIDEEEQQYDNYKDMKGKLNRLKIMLNTF